MKKADITASASLAGLAVLLAALPLSFPFPPIPYLRFDLAEIPVFIALMGFGPFPGMLATLIYYGVLLVVGEFTPLGPTLKFLAVFSSMVGFWAGANVVRSRGLTKMVLAGSFAGAVARVLVMTAANYVVLAVLFPEFLQFATATLSAFVGDKLSADFHGLAIVLAFTAAYNIIHIVFSVAPSILALNYLNRASALSSVWVPWVIKASKPRNG